MKTAQIKLSNGVEFTADDCGGSFAVNEKPDFPNGVFSVKIERKEFTEELSAVRLVECYSIDGRYWFNFLPLSEQEKRIIELEDALCELSKE
jgi:hypothetical protein